MSDQFVLVDHCGNQKWFFNPKPAGSCRHDRSELIFSDTDPNRLSTVSLSRCFVCGEILRWDSHTHTSMKAHEVGGQA